MLSGSRSFPDGTTGSFQPFGPPLMGKATTARARAKAFESQAHRCYYCGVLTWNTDPDRFATALGLDVRSVAQLRCTAEHLHARCDGGTDESENISAACSLCNRRRHARAVPMKPDRYRVHVQGRMAQQRWHPAWVFRTPGLCRTATNFRRQQKMPID
jgi:hypothetical protein